MEVSQYSEPDSGIVKVFLGSRSFNINEKTLVFKVGGKVCGLADLVSHDFDTKHFGISTYKLENALFDDSFVAEILKSLNSYAASSSRALIKFDMPADFLSLKLYQEAGFALVGLPITMRWKKGSVSPENNIVFRDVQNSDIDALSAMVRQAFMSSQFYNNPIIKHDSADNFYSEWAKNACSGRADFVIVADDEGPKGFIACKIHEDEGWIDLLAVDRSAGGRGIGTGLIAEACRRFSSKGLKKILVKTEATNYAALAVYGKCGFKVTSLGFNLHKVIDEV